MLEMSITEMIYGWKYDTRLKFKKYLSTLHFVSKISWTFKIFKNTFKLSKLLSNFQIAF